MLSVKEAMDVLRLDNDDRETRYIVESLLEAVPQYLETTTGLKPEEQERIPLCNTVAAFLLRLWYYPEGVDTYRLVKVIDGLLKTLTITTASK